MSSQLRVDPLTGLKSLVGDAPLAPDAAEPERDAAPDLFTAQPASGVHEQLPGGLDQLPAALETWRERMRAHPDAAYLHVTATGADAELFALDFVPAAVARERERASAYMTRTMGGNLLGDYVQEEVRRRARLVAYDDDAVALCPYAPRVPHQVLIAPRTPRPRYEADDGPSGAGLVGELLGRLERVGAPGVRLTIRTAPRGASGFCWRIDLVPAAGDPPALEAGTGVAACPLAPEQAAADLRAAAA